MSVATAYEKASSQIAINGELIDFSVSAEHVGMLRSTAGNTPTILARITAHKQALGGVLHTGVARGHRGNPAVLKLSSSMPFQYSSLGLPLLCFLIRN